MIVVDCNALIMLVTQKGSSDDLARLDSLVADLTKRRSYVGVPTPALAEFLVRTNAATQAVLDSLEHKAAIRVLPFDKKAAFECSMLDKKALANGSKRGSARGEPYQKVKIDRQIIAIAIANGAEMIVSGDGPLIGLANDAGVDAKQVTDLPLPAAARQHRLKFEEERAKSAVDGPSSPAAP